MSESNGKPQTLRLVGATVVLPFKTQPVPDAGLPAVTGTFRPASPREVRTYRERLGRAATAEEAVGIESEFLASHVKSWDVDDGTAPITAEVFASGQVPYSVYQQFEPIILGYAGGNLLGN